MEQQEAEDYQTWRLLREAAADREVADAKPEDLVPKVYHKFMDVFSKKESERMPLRKPWDHAIELKEDFKPKKGRLIPLSHEEQQEVSDFIDAQLKKGYIRPSKSPQTAPVFFVPKKDGKKRMVQDYRYLNEWTIPNNYPLPLISQLVDKLQGTKWFTKMDLRWGYNNVRIKEGDEWKAAFVCHRGSFEPLVMYFGLMNSPATFQTMMNELFADMEDVVIIYMDNLLIYTKGSKEEHEEVVKQVLQRLRDNDLFIKPEKCSFSVSEVDYLGMIVSRDGVRMDESKIQAIQEWPTPMKVKHVRGFLGLANFYRRFIQDFATIARPLNDLTKKDLTWKWTDKEQKAFETLKQLFTTAPILAYPDNNCKFRVECDSSDYATGAVLSMECSDGIWRPCAFSSHSLNEAERNYQIADKEMLAIIRALEQWRHYLEGSKYKFEIWSDHKNVQYFMMSQDLNRRQARWALYLSRFNFTLIHKAGTSMTKADALSHRPDHAGGIEDDNKGVIMIKPEWIKAQRKVTFVEGNKRIIIDKIRENSKNTSLNELDKTGNYKLVDGLYYVDKRIYVPKNDELRIEIVESHHDSPIAGHPGKR